MRRKKKFQQESLVEELKIREKIRQNFINMKQDESSNMKIDSLQHNLTNDQLLEMFGESIEQSKVEEEEGDANIMQDNITFDQLQSMSHVNDPELAKTVQGKKWPSMGQMRGETTPTAFKSTVKGGMMNQSQIFSSQQRFDGGEGQIENKLAKGFNKDQFGKNYPVAPGVDDLIKTVQKDVGKRMSKNY